MPLEQIPEALIIASELRQEAKRCNLLADRLEAAYSSNKQVNIHVEFRHGRKRKGVVA